MKNLNGFSLLEVIVSLVILSVVALGALAAMSQGKYGTMGGQDKLIAMHLVEEKLNELKEKGADELIINQNPKIINRNTVEAGAEDYKYVEQLEELSYEEAEENPPTMNVKISYASDPSDEKFKAIETWIEWRDRTSNLKKESVMTMVYQE